MTIRSRKEIEKRGIEVDLTGPQGNAFYLLGLAGKLSEQLGKDKEAIRAEMMAADYEYLLEVFEREFGAYVILYR